ncbi:4-alpha-glucanotransferase [Lonepinella koalarum]|uniref:4-alpha-glucanotransferase n=1 Tax=Lonepinella koalarum TaxID=53417 RepID=A0A4R1L0H5_9PAST|nr:4-alpha-glucanotransferase [Lonepinella koalarum]MDH2927019.1 4-alpha-glucanotransferase [Lonepinella koalarum]TCK70323.1 4-alpha-glucanotransferase [Lonepinella koalarum]TFJ89289.1 4-alpha-glucanotransferase [Lonepinella koalarum]
MNLTEQQRCTEQKAEKLGICLSHYDIDGHFITVSAETLDYFTALLSTENSQSNDHFDDVFVINAEQATNYSFSSFFLSVTTCRLTNEQDEILLEQQSQQQISLPALPVGYYQLTLSDQNQQRKIRLLVQPKTTFQSPLLEQQKAWGINVQLYSLRSERNWGIGDFADLTYLVQHAVQFGADFIGINPLHKMYAAVPDWASPYSATSRRWLNPIYLAVDWLPEYKLAKSVQTWFVQQQDEMTRLRQQPQVDYQAISRLKFTALEQLFAFSQRSKTAKIITRRQAFLDFVKQQGDNLLNQALFDVLDGIEHPTHQAEEKNIGWLGWRKEWQQLSDKNRNALIKKYQNQIEFYMWLQWLTEQQLAEVKIVAQKVGLQLGIYGDLAVQSSRGSADVWSDPELYCVNASIGAPPDPLGPIGQNWNLPPYNPTVLKARGFQPFIEMLRANMQHFGVLRIDHVMGLFRLWLIPENKTAVNGVYVFYPFAELMAILAIESQRNQCVIVGEDLGTVADEVRSTLNQFLIYSYFVLYFSQANGEFPPAEKFPTQAFATIGTHDVPSLRSFWHCKDLALFEQLGVLQGDFLQQKYQQRVEDKQALLNSLHRDHYLPDDYDGDALSMAMHDHLNFVIHRYLACSQSRLIGVQLENLIDQEVSFNLPGTSTEYPNWQIKLAMPLEQIFSDPRIQALLNEINHNRKSL